MAKTDLFGKGVADRLVDPGAEPHRRRFHRWRSAPRVSDRRRYAVRGSTAEECAGRVAALQVLGHALVALLIMPLPARVAAEKAADS